MQHTYSTHIFSQEGTKHINRFQKCLLVTVHLEPHSRHMLSLRHDVLRLARCCVTASTTTQQQAVDAASAHLLRTASAVRPVRSAMSSQVSSALATAGSAAAAAPRAPAAEAFALLPAVAVVAGRSCLAEAGRVGRLASGIPSKGPPRRFLSMTLDCRPEGDNLVEAHLSNHLCRLLHAVCQQVSDSQHTYLFRQGLRCTRGSRSRRKPGNSAFPSGC